MAGALDRLHETSLFFALYGNINDSLLRAGLRPRQSSEWIRVSKRKDSHDACPQSQSRNYSTDTSVVVAVLCSLYPGAERESMTLTVTAARRSGAEERRRFTGLRIHDHALNTNSG